MWTGWFPQVILEGIPRNAPVDEVERFLSGYGYDGSSIQMFVRLILS